MWSRCSQLPVRFAILLLALAILLLPACSRQAGNSRSGAINNISDAAVRLTASSADASEPGIAADDAGNIYVIYVEHHDPRNADIKLLRLDGERNRIGEATLVNDAPGDAKVWAGDPPTIVVGGKDIYVGWTRKLREPGARGNDLVVSVSRDSGITFEPPVRVNDDAAPASHGMHSIAVGENGEVIMLWLDERSLVGRAAPMTGHEMAEPNAEAYYAISKDGGRSFGANRKIAGDVCPCCKTTLLVDHENSIYAAWRQVLDGEHRHIAVARSDNGGETFNKQVIVSDDKWQINACPVSGAALLSPRAGTLDVLWYTAGDAGQPGLYFARSTDKGGSFSPRIMLSNEAKAGTPSASVDGDNELVVFPTSDGRIDSVRWNDSPASSTTRATIPDAILPGIVTSAGKTTTVFVRTIDSKRSVWMQ